MGPLRGLRAGVRHLAEQLAAARISDYAASLLSRRVGAAGPGEKAGRWRTRSEGVTENAKGVRFCFSSAPPAV